jgi:tetratricopeptide (TPR) repeat protein
MATPPGDVLTLMIVSRIYAAIGRQDEAMHALDSALAIKPESAIYLNRYHIRPKSDLAGRQGDIDAAIRLEPTSVEALSAKADLLGERGDWRGVAAAMTPLIAKTPTGTNLLVRRGIAYAKAGDAPLADKDFAAARALTQGAQALNNLCWAKAIAGVGLDRALEECDAALTAAPEDTQIQDSRAFVLLRMGRVDDALALYNTILAKAPTQAASLYGRAVAEDRKGDAAAADHDVAAALKANPKEAETFASYGMALKARAGG